MSNCKNRAFVCYFCFCFVELFRCICLWRFNVHFPHFPFELLRLLVVYLVKFCETCIHKHTQNANRITTDFISNIFHIHFKSTPSICTHELYTRFVWFQLILVEISNAHTNKMVFLIFLLRYSSDSLRNDERYSTTQLCPILIRIFRSFSKCDLNIIKLHLL